MAENRTEVQLAQKKQLIEAIDKEDDWTGLSDPAARRRRQNRLHQRAWRRRKALEKLSTPNPSYITYAHDQAVLNQHTDALEDPYTHGGPRPPSDQYSLFNCIFGPVHSTSFPPSPDSQNGSNTSQQYPRPASKLIPPILPYRDSCSLTFEFGSSSWQFAFPLPADQRLITLCQYNVLRATLTNMKLMGQTMPVECGGALVIATLPTPDEIPPAMWPTALQKAIPHEPWIDLFPVGAFRDNLILNRTKFDEDEFCDDLCGGLYDGFDDVQLRGILVWSDPWSVDGWEVTEGFVKKWGFLLKGCGSVIEATNRYRASRHEEPLIVEV